MNFESVLTQLLQPYFYYSVIFLAISYVCIGVVLKYCSFFGRKARSMAYLLPLMIPLFVMLAYNPSTVTQTTSSSLVRLAVAVFQSPLAFAPTTPQIFIVELPVYSIIEIPSITGIICLIGLAAGGFFSVTMLLLGDRAARKALHVIELDSDEYPWLQAQVREISKKLAMCPPKVGLTEDLRPNAFTIGYSSRKMLVFSIGLLNILTKEEITAVASHELAHLKNHDFFFKTLSYALTAVSFFNPLSYFASSKAQRERELLADEHGARLLQKPAALGSALAKICIALQALPKEGVLVRMTSNLFVTSSILHRPQLLAAHPRIDQRLRNISRLSSKSPSGNRRMAIAVLLSLVVLGGALASYVAASLQVRFAPSVNLASVNFKAIRGPVCDHDVWSDYQIISEEINASQMNEPPMHFGLGVPGEAVLLCPAYVVFIKNGTAPNGLLPSPMHYPESIFVVVNGTSMFDSV